MKKLFLCFALVGMASTLCAQERRRDDRIQLLFLIRTTTAGCLAPSPAPPEAARE